MVKGLKVFQEHFAPYINHYVLIGGTACSLLMEEAGLGFRATKDLDIVLSIEVLDKVFISAFWEFIKKGGYHNRQRSTGNEIFYRFDSPSSPAYPEMLELFSRVADMEVMDDQCHLQRIKMSEVTVSLSAILLNEDYYKFIHAGKCEIHGLSIVKASHLIPLKACAWRDLMEKQKNSVHIDNKDIRKHKNDIIRLFQLLSPNNQVKLPDSIKKDMNEFIEIFETDKSIDINQLGLKHANLETVVANLRKIYELS